MSEASGTGLVALLRAGQNTARNEPGTTARRSTATAGSTYSSVAKDKMTVLDSLEQDIEDSESKILIKGNNT